MHNISWKCVQCQQCCFMGTDGLTDRNDAAITRLLLLCKLAKKKQQGEMQNTGKNRYSQRFHRS
jgi:hypothetical protein